MNVPGIPKNYNQIKIIDEKNLGDALKILEKNFSYADTDYFKFLINNYDNGDITDDMIREFMIFSKNNRLTFSINGPLDENKFKNLWAKKIIDINFNCFANIIIQFLCAKYKIISKKILEEYYDILNKNKFDKYRLYIYLHQTIDINLEYSAKDFYSTYILGSCLYHEESLKMYRLFMFFPLLSGSRDCYLHLNNFLEYMINEFDIINMKRYIVFSGGILSLTGLRYCGDIDIIFSLSKDELNVQKKINEIDIKKNMVDIKNVTKSRNHYKLEINGFNSYIRWAKTTGAQGIDDMILNSKYHWFFMGIKLTDLTFEVNKKIERPFPKSILDLILFNYYFKYNIELPNLDIKFFKRISANSKMSYFMGNRINYCIFYNVFDCYMGKLLPKKVYRKKKIFIGIIKNRYPKMKICK